MDLKAVQQSIAPVAGAFGVSAPEAPATATTTGQKTMADVADRALDGIEAVTAKIASTLEKVAPQVWRIMVRQQYAKAFSEPVGPLAWIISMLVFLIVSGKVWRHVEGADIGDLTEDGRNNLRRLIITRVGPLVIICIATIAFGYALKDSVLYLVNPEYYAIQDLLKSIMSGGNPT